MPFTSPTSTRFPRFGGKLKMVNRDSLGSLLTHTRKGAKWLVFAASFKLCCNGLCLTNSCFHYVYLTLSLWHLGCPAMRLETNNLA
jgi:hypothetical protein